jgi:hypothetical protein
MKGKVLLASLICGPFIVLGFGLYTPASLASEAEDDLVPATPAVEVEADADLRAATTGRFEGCTASFWRGTPESGVDGGRWLWNDVIDPDWYAHGGEGANPNIWIYGFNTFFTPMPELAAATMMSLLDQEGQVEEYEKAAGALVAAYLNASWGMAYPYTKEELAAKWDTAVQTGNFFDLRRELEHANEGEAGCPISAVAAE